MRRILTIVLLGGLVGGCAYGQEKIRGYLDDPKTLLEDPLSVEHQRALDDLERAYLHKEISYADYLERKRRLEEDYARAVKERRDTIENVR